MLDGRSRTGASQRRTRVTRQRNPVEERAVRAARAAGIGPQPAPPAIARGGFLFWAFTRVLALVVLLGTAWIVNDAATSDRFQVTSVRVTGNVLVDRPEIDAAVAAQGVNLFWVDRRAIEARLRMLPPVRSATVTPILPDTLDVHVEERQPAALWQSGQRRYLVDAEGVILTSIEDAPEARLACSGERCGPGQAPPMLTVAQPDGQPLTPGDRVDTTALATSARLASLLPAAGIQPLAFEWRSANGIEVPTASGWRARFDGSRDVERQISTLRTIRDWLAQSKITPQVIDVRFGDRPYYQ